MGELNDYVLFKKHFVKHYWDNRQQNQIRIEITQGKYNPKGKMLMIDYFMGIKSKDKNLEPTMSDQELSSLIIPHFPDHIRNNLYIAKPLDFGEMIDLLTQFESSSNYHNSPTNYFGHSTNKSCHKIVGVIIIFLGDSGQGHHRPSYHKTGLGRRIFIIIGPKTPGTEMIEITKRIIVIILNGIDQTKGIEGNGGK